MTELRFSELTEPRQVLIRACQQVVFGAIRDLELRGREPFFGPKTEIVFDIKLDIDEAPRPEQSLTDFIVSGEIRRLMSKLDAWGDGTIEYVEVRAGIPRRVRFKTAIPMNR